MELNYGGHHTNSQQIPTSPKIPWWLSFPVISIITFFIFPIGIFLIWKRKKVDTNSKGIITIAIGGAFITMGLIMFQTVVRGIPESNYSGIVPIFVTGIVIIFFGRKKRRKHADKITKYVSIILVNREKSISNIASLVNTSYNDTLTDIKGLIQKGYLGGIYVNEAHGKIIFAEDYVPHSQHLNIRSRAANNTQEYSGDNQSANNNQESNRNSPSRSNTPNRQSRINDHGINMNNPTSTSTQNVVYSSNTNMNADDIEKIFEDLQPIMNRAFGVDINVNNNTNASANRNNPSTNTNVSTNTSEPREAVIACKGCGANHTVMRGSIVECQYCGSSISN